MRTRSKRNNNNNNKKKSIQFFSSFSRLSFEKKKGKNKKKKIGGSLIPFRSVTKLATALLAVVSYRDGFTRLVSSVGLALKSGIEAAACQSVIFYCTWIGSSGYDIVNHREQRSDEWGKQRYDACNIILKRAARIEVQS